MRLARIRKLFLQLSWSVARLLAGIRVEPIPNTHVYDALTRTLPRTLRVHVLDGVYYAPASHRDVERLATVIAVKRVPYVAELFDCDDYALLFATVARHVFGVNAVGMVVDYGMRHAYNIIVDAEKNVWVVEPQTATVMDPRGAHVVGYLREGLVII